MEIIKNSLSGVFEIDLNPFKDKRGFFMRTFDRNLFSEKQLDFNWVQENHSQTNQTGVIRGLHFQFPPYAETKMVRCVRGAILDVFVDLRKGSPTFGRWGSVELSEENKKLVIVPRGFAHGFCTLTDLVDVLYKVDNVYSPEHEGGIAWNDPGLNIQWPVQNPFLSEKDSCNGSFKSFVKKYKGIEV